MREDVAIRTTDGECRSFVFRPDDQAAYPAVIFYMDGGAIRPALFEMAECLASFGYVVLLPDMFYRAGLYSPFDLPRIFALGVVRDVIGPYASTVNNDRAAQDTTAFIAYLDARKDIAGRALGAVGYCMGGGWALTAAGRFPDRIAAAASFHGTELASDSPMSPHLLAPQMRGEIYVAGAVEDKGYPPDMAARLDRALAAANVRHRCEVYDGARHAWTMRDVPAYDEAATERHWRELIALFARALKPSAV